MVWRLSRGARAGRPRVPTAQRATALIGDESGQSLVFSALATGLVLLLLSFGAIGAAFLISARAALAKAADAAALAALEQTSASATLQVSYVDYLCQWSYQWGSQGGYPQRSGSLSCTSSPGQTTEAAGGGGAFAAGSSGTFGPLPGWAAGVGCIGTVWPGTVGSAGTYRICTGQQVMAAGLSESDRAQMERAAEQWLGANVQMDAELSGASVTKCAVGPDGQVTVTAEADVRPGLLMFRHVRVAETAWPGQSG